MSIDLPGELSDGFLAASGLKNPQPKLQVAAAPPLPCTAYLTCTFIVTTLGDDTASRNRTFGLFQQYPSSFDDFCRTLLKKIPPDFKQLNTVAKALNVSDSHKHSSLDYLQTFANHWQDLLPQLYRSCEAASAGSWAKYVAGCREYPALGAVLNSIYSDDQVPTCLFPAPEKS